MAGSRRPNIRSQEYCWIFTKHFENLQTQQEFEKKKSSNSKTENQPLSGK